MSSELGAEVVGCDASIMKNVWEIRVRDYAQKMHLEQTRLDKSALTTINQDWANRMTAKMGGYKRTERKARRAEIQTDDDIWKSKQPPTARTVTRGVGSGALGRPGIQSRGVPTAAPNYKGKKGQDTILKGQHLLMFMTQSQPSTMVWGKAWKYNKSLPLPEEGSLPSNWGQCWMFSTQQPCSEEDKPWPDEPNIVDPESLHLWRKPEYVRVESQQLDSSLPSEEWEVSWRRSDCIKEHDKSVNRENMPKYGFFTSLVETQHDNEVLCSSEWIDSWQLTKPANHQDNHHSFTDANEGSMDDAFARKHDKAREMSTKWGKCWRFSNHHGSNKSTLPQLQAMSPEWASSWRAAPKVKNNVKTSDHTQDFNGLNDHDQEFLDYEIMHVPHTHAYKDSGLKLDRFEAFTEWNKSWQVIKNNKKPCEEIEKVLKAAPQLMEMDSGPHRVQESPMVSYSEKPDPRYEHLRHDVIYKPKREFTESKMVLLKQLQKVLPPSEWTDSWKLIKHRMRKERKRYRLNPLKPFRDSEKGGERKPPASEWKGSWKFTCHPLNQNPDLWQQGWLTTPQIRANWERHQTEFSYGEFPKNGPTEERIWGESWRFSRHQHRSEPGQGKVTQGRSSMPSHHPHNLEQRKHVRSDWQEAWMVSETQFHHDKPSLIQWRDAWRWTIYHTLHFTEHVPRDKWVDESYEIQQQKSVISLERAKARMSRSFDNQMFRERYPEKDWRSSWSAMPLLKHKHNSFESSGTTGQSKSGGAQKQHPITCEFGSKWGRSFRIANPMPHLDQPWVESHPNPAYYSVMWSKGKKIKFHLSTGHANFKFWANSHLFLQGHSSQVKGKMGQNDPRVILTKKTRTRKHLFSNLEKEKQFDKKWAGCHLLGKTQPRLKKSRDSVRKLKTEEETDEKFFEEWVESWKFLVRPESLKKGSFRSLSGWVESWKFLLPLYQHVS